MLNSSSDTLAMNDDFLGRMNDPSAGAWVTGPCGDTMEFYLIIEYEIIRQAKYHTDGCRFTRLCGHTVAAYVQGKSVVETLSVSGKQILAALPQLPLENRHCAILAVSAFYRRHWPVLGGTGEFVTCRNQTANWGILSMGYLSSPRFMAGFSCILTETTADCRFKIPP